MPVPKIFLKVKKKHLHAQLKQIKHLRELLIDIARACQTKTFYDYVDGTYPKELKIKDITYTAMSASYLDLHIEIDREWWLRRKEIITISQFQVICSNITNPLFF